MSRSLCWLSDATWAAIEPHLPKNQPGARRVDDRRVISGIVHMLKCGGGPRSNAIGISRGGRTTKIHALVDVLGRPLRLALTPGNTSDIKGADLLVGATAGMKRVIADRGYDANRLQPEAAHPIRRAPLPGPLAGRGPVLPAQGLPPRCDPL